MSQSYSPYELIPEQLPAPHSRNIRYTGGKLRITLTLPRAASGHAFVRTNLGQARVKRQEVVEAYDTKRARTARDWWDIPMRQSDARHFEVVLPICEVGIYEFKACFVDDATGLHHWPRGENACVKVEPALYVARNTIYNAFVRQFGPNISSSAENQQLREAISALDQAGYTVLPPSGTFRDIISRLDFIQDELGFRIIQLLPIHPTPTTYGRMGRFGSPFAPVDFYSVDPALANFDRRATPLDQFNELTDQIHSRGGLVFLDLPIDHTGWASTMQIHHPEWFHHEADGSFQSPGAWGTIWEDLCKLDFDNRALWKEMANVFLHWCRNGVDGFRCDAGYMIPHDAWEYIIARVRQEYPDTLFFLEGLGGGMDATTRLMASAGMNWAYSELFQNYSTQEISSYLDHAVRFSRDTGALVNFAETHDNSRLAEKSPAWAALRVSLSALFAPSGCFGIANGVEWLATEKIDVHESRSLNWGAENNLVQLISRLNQLTANHPAFKADAELRVPFGGGGSAVGLLRVPADSPEDTVLVIANPNLHSVASYEWNFKEFDTVSAPYDLLSGRRIPVRCSQCQMQMQLKPAEVLCLSLRPREIRNEAPAPEYVHAQLLRQTVLKFLVARNGYGDIGGLDIETLARALYHNPLEFLKRITGENVYLPVVEWHPEMDRNRVVPIPPDHHILINHGSRFIASLYIHGKYHQKIYSDARADGRFFALFQPAPKVRRTTYATLKISTFRPDGSLHVDAQLMLLPPLERQAVHCRITRQRLNRLQCGIAATNLGGYSQARAQWGALESQYDALLAVNQHPTMPVDRTIVLNRCRAWVIYRDFSTEVNADCQTTFAQTGANSMRWDFIVPTGMGGSINLAVNSRLDRESGRLQLSFTRLAPQPAEGLAAPLDNNEPVTLLLRPDIDDRSFHGNTTATDSVQEEFPRRLSALGSQGFAFRLSSGNRLEMRAPEGTYLSSPEWLRSVRHSIEGERGLKAEGDIFSPGYFKFSLLPDSSASLEAEVLRPEEHGSQPRPAIPCTFAEPAPQRLSFQDALDQAADAFVVKRDEFKSIIAGYPWFLDWGRDTLICTRGLIAAGRTADALEIIRKFASFEENGTLPNMISGQQLSNRDTSDAQLLLFLAVIDYINAIGRNQAKKVLETECGDRTLVQVLVSIADNYIKGTPNGIRADAETGLVYSPPHFTWMDTNFPAATPREGYPVEIQAYWYAALRLLAEFADHNGIYQALADKVKENFLRLYYLGKHAGLSDCLHAEAGVSALKAKADDHLRPNQLFAVTLGLVDDPECRRQIVRACSSLLVPGAMRSLADQPVTMPLPVTDEGRPLNDPLHPYWGRYEGDENTRRKPAYHNGTAWCLQMPLYCEALYLTYGESAREAAGAILGTAAYLMGSYCLGQLPEILDGSSPHTQRGCWAQAWSVTECRRVLEMLK